MRWYLRPLLQFSNFNPYFNRASGMSPVNWYDSVDDEFGVKNRIKSHFVHSADKALNTILH